MTSNQEILLTIASSTCSSMFYDLVNAEEDADCLLFGTVQQHSSESIEDQHTARPVERINIAIQSAVSIGRSFAFYNARGEVDRAAFQQCIQSNGKFLGWCRYRRQSPSRPSLREVVVHREICEIMHPITQHPIIFGILSSSATPNFSTLGFSYAFMWFPSPNGPFEELSCEIASLNIQTGKEYEAFKATSPVSGKGGSNSNFSQAIDQVTGKFSSSGLSALLRIPPPAVGELETLTQNMLRKLSQLSEQVEKSEGDLVTQQQRIANLRGMLSEKGIPSTPR